MTSFEINSQKRDPVKISETSAGDSNNPLSFKFSTRDKDGWQHLTFQLNYVNGQKDITVEQGYYFRINGTVELPKDLNVIAGIFSSCMWTTAQEVETVVRKKGVQSLHTYEWILEAVQKGLGIIEWPKG